MCRLRDRACSRFQSAADGRGRNGVAASCPRSMRTIACLVSTARANAPRIAKPAWMRLSPATAGSLPCGAGKAELPPVRNSSLAMGRMLRPQPATAGLPRPTRGRSGWLLQEGPSVLPFASSVPALRPAPFAEKAKRPDRQDQDRLLPIAGFRQRFKSGWLNSLLNQAAIPPVSAANRGDRGTDQELGSFLTRRPSTSRIIKRSFSGVPSSVTSFMAVRTASRERRMLSWA